MDDGCRDELNGVKHFALGHIDLSISANDREFSSRVVVVSSVRDGNSELVARCLITGIGAGRREGDSFEVTRIVGSVAACHCDVAAYHSVARCGSRVGKLVREVEVKESVACEVCTWND